MAWTLMWLWALLALGEAMPEAREEDKRENYCRRHRQSVLQLGNYAYIDGGTISGYVDGELTGRKRATSIQSTLSLPLDQEWTNVTVPFTRIRGSRPRPVNSAAFWLDDSKTKIYRWGGERGFQQGMPEDDVNLWSFTPDDDGQDGSWEAEDPNYQWGSDRPSASTNGASAFCANKGFWVGGYGKNSSDPKFDGVSPSSIPPVPGILTYDMETKELRNDSTVSLSPPYGSFVNGGAACATGLLAHPLVMVFGGLTTSPVDVSGGTFHSMRNISFWDPETKEWHWQGATGDVPDGREKFCAVGAQGKNSTYEIFVYGGKRPDNTTGDIYVLSIPGFQWFQVDVDSPPRFDHGCAVVGKSQMLSTGGLTEDDHYNDMDPWSYSLGIFDMTGLAWKDKYDPHAPDYDSPQVIKDWYNNGGMATVSWSSDDVMSMFAKGSGVMTGSRTETGQDESSSTPVGAIAGGVVGGVSGLAIVGAGLWVLLRRRRQKHDESGETPSPVKDGAKPHDDPGTPTEPKDYREPAESSDLADSRDLAEPREPADSREPTNSNFRPPPAELSTDTARYELSPDCAVKNELPPDNIVRSELPGSSAIREPSPEMSSTS